MFIYLFIILFLFSFISGLFLMGRHILSFWLTIIVIIISTFLLMFSFICLSVCLYGWQFYDYCLILMFDASYVSLTFYCTAFYLYILFIIDIVFCFILFYAFYYMYFDVTLNRFFSILWCFVLSMNFFLVSHDMLTAYCAWELLGFFSFLLISYFWYRFFALKFGFKSFFISKIGDALLLVAFVYIYLINGYCVITFYFLSFLCFDYYCINYILFLIIGCAFTKSTQFGLHAWLPDAMEGPIPVSALIHAATLVVCGIILISFIFWCYDFWFAYYYYLIVWSSLILVLMSLCVFYNFDVKRYIAFSTICQISFSLFCCLCLDLYVGSLFFCYHMFYKATLFIVIGVWIHFFYGLQDLRCYFFLYFCGCLLARLLLIFALLNSCSLWFLCGFYCKDLLLCSLMLVSFFYVFEFFCVCFIFILLTIIYNYFLLLFLFFTFKCFCMSDCLFLLFDFECCLIYCLMSLYMCFILLFLIIDFIYAYMYVSQYIFLSFYVSYANVFDIATIIVVLIMIISFMYYGSNLFFFFSVDCINLFWRLFLFIFMFILFILFSCWYYINFLVYSMLFVWNLVIYCRYNFKYCLFFSILLLLYV